jgi:hypothetical protein
MAELPTHCVSPELQVPWQDATPPSDEQVDAVQATAAPQFPVASHVATPLPEHWVAPGTQTPPHAPLAHAKGQALGALHVPLEVHVSSPLPEHCVALGAHCPLHAPATHVWFVHAVVPPHWPFEPQVWTPLPEQRVAPGAHTPPQAPFTQAYVHALGAPNVPAVQVSTPLAPASPVGAHVVDPGEHTPWHDAEPPVPMHAWLPQSTGGAH